MIKLHNESDCCGCTACESVCPAGAITMEENAEGFLYPVVSERKCTRCGRCTQVCPFIHSADDEKTPPLSVYAAKHRDRQTLAESSSGGMFTALSDLVLEKGGVVYGAIFDENFVVMHARAITKEQRDGMRGSKYVQSDMREILKSVAKDLALGKTVLFTGTPCQVDGLRRYLSKEYSNLITCDLVCHGVPSPLIWKEHVRFLEQQKHSKLRGYQFRPKRWGWRVHNELVTFANGKEYHSTGYSNLFRDLYYGRLIMRPSCHRCPYTNLHRPSDITIADCRGIEEALPAFACEEGVSLVLINTPKGERAFETITGTLDFTHIDINAVLQPPLRGSSTENPKRAEFWAAYAKYGYRGAIRQHFGRLYNLKQIVKRKIGRI